MHDDEPSSNPQQQSSFPSFPSFDPSRRLALKATGAIAALAGVPMAGCVAATPKTGTTAATPTFEPVALAGNGDEVVVPKGYEAYVLYAWGDPVSTGPAFRPDASNTADEQAQQAGMHHDGIHFFPMPENRGLSSTHGLLVMNHEYTMFVNIQHPGESPSERSDPMRPAAISSWPDGKGARPRSATVVIRRLDGGLVGS